MISIRGQKARAVIPGKFIQADLTYLTKAGRVQLLTLWYSAGLTNK